MDNEISIVPFRYKYLPALLSLLASNDYQDIEVVTMKTLPKIGYIALMGGHPIAAGFLRKVEGGYGQLDTLTSNKHYGSIVRHKGIKLIVDTLIQDAKDLRLTGMLALTTDDGVLKRAVEAYGWTITPHKVIAVTFK